jgi:CheY-like chemotaxis protein
MIERKRILFVDDEPAVLAGLQAAFRRDRERWDMVFAPGSDAAVAMLATAEFDAVVSDMRMPGMDGAGLLDHVQNTSPQTRRIMLSGSTDSQDAMRAAAAAEEVLTKPCSARTVRATLERLLAAEDAVAATGS